MPEASKPSHLNYLNRCTVHCCDEQLVADLMY